MVQKRRYFLFFLALTLLVFSFPVVAVEYLVSTKKEFKNTVKSLKAGDTIVLKNGIYKNFDISFYGKGKKGKPISLRAQTKGKVIVTGKSNLRISGNYIVVSGLVFKDGYSPKGEVVSFRKGKGVYATNSRITEIVIDHFNKARKFDQDYWVGMYGKNNRFDHSYLVGKSNKGVTLAVRLDDPSFLNNNHRIDHNYFGHRPVFGANGAETLRIGTSKYSLGNSNTIVEFNYFDRCNGEIEVISNKSGGNVYRNNTFFESRGALTLRHGSGNLVENNFFFGNNKDHTGGIRVINANQTIKNNYMHGLTGRGFGSAFVVMNGSKNPPLNRYHQVDNALIENNSIINSAHVQFSAGKSEERNAPPVNSAMRYNFIYNDDVRNIFTIYDDVSGVDFHMNALVNVDDMPVVKGLFAVTSGLQQDDNGIWYPDSPALSKVGISRDISPVSLSDVGPTWYPKPLRIESVFAPRLPGQIINVAAGNNALSKAVAESKPGHTLVLEPGIYDVDSEIPIVHPVTIKAKSTGSVFIRFKSSSLFSLNFSASLKLVGLNISGEQSRKGKYGNSVIRTKSSKLRNYNLILESVNVSNLSSFDAFDFLRIHEQSFAEIININNSVFKNISGSVLALNKETEDRGLYNVEYVTVKNSEFSDIKGHAVSLYRGGTDESTFGPHLKVSSSKFVNVGINNDQSSWQKAVFLHGVQRTELTDNIFEKSGDITINHTIGKPKTYISDNRFVSSPLPVIKELVRRGTPTDILKDNVSASQ